jgi:hypothetical protein
MNTDDIRKNINNLEGMLDNHILSIDTISINDILGLSDNGEDSLTSETSPYIAFSNLSESHNSNSDILTNIFTNTDDDTDAIVTVGEISDVKPHVVISTIQNSQSQKSESIFIKSASKMSDSLTKYKLVKEI